MWAIRSVDLPCIIVVEIISVHDSRSLMNPKNVGEEDLSLETQKRGGVVVAGGSR